MSDLIREFMQMQKAKQNNQNVVNGGPYRPDPYAEGPFISKGPYTPDPKAEGPFIVEADFPQRSYRPEPLPEFDYRAPAQSEALRSYRPEALPGPDYGYRPQRQETSFLRQEGTPVHYTDGTTSPPPARELRKRR